MELKLKNKKIKKPKEKKNIVFDKKFDKKNILLWVFCLPVMIVITLWKTNKLVIAAVVLIAISAVLSVVSLAQPIVDEEIAKQEEMLNRAKAAIEIKDYVTAQSELNSLAGRRLGSDYKKEAKTLLETVNPEADKMKEQQKQNEEKEKKAEEEKAKVEEAKKAGEEKNAGNVIDEELQKYYDERSISLLKCTGISEAESTAILNDLKSVGIYYISKCVNDKSNTPTIEGVKVYEIKFENKLGKLAIKGNKTFYIDYGGMLFDATKGGVTKKTND